MPGALLNTSCSSLFMLTFGRHVTEQRNLMLRRVILYRVAAGKEATAIVQCEMSVCVVKTEHTQA